MTTFDIGNTDLPERMAHLPPSEMLALLGGQSSDAVAQMAVEWAHKASARKLSQEDVRAINAVIDAQNGGFVSNQAQQYQLARVVDILYEEGPRPAVLWEQVGRERGNVGEWLETVSNSKAALADGVRDQRERDLKQSLAAENDLRDGAVVTMVLASAYKPALEAKVQQRYMEHGAIAAPQQSAAVTPGQVVANPQAVAKAQAEGELGPPEPPDDVPDRDISPRT